MKRNEDSFKGLWNNIKHTNVSIKEVPERENRKKKSEKIFEEIIAEIFLNLGKETVTQVQEVQRIKEHTKTHCNQDDKN